MHYENLLWTQSTGHSSPWITGLELAGLDLPAQACVELDGETGIALWTDLLRLL